MSKKQTMLIFDFGSQYTHLIKSSLAKLGFNSEIIPADAKFNLWTRNNLDKNVKGLILSGGAYSFCEDKIYFNRLWILQGLPVLGICYGHQLLANFNGANVKRRNGEFGKSSLRIIKHDPILQGVENCSIVWMSHNDSVTTIPPELDVIASSDYSEVAIFKDKTRKIYGVQFHPEVSHTEYGLKILENFCKHICNMRKDTTWSSERFIKSSIYKIREFVDKANVICAVSGGVDSLTMVMLLRRAIPEKQLLAVYVDNGLMPDKTEDEVRNFCESFGIRLKVTRQTKIFFGALKGVIDPEKKTIIIGKKFIEVFEKIAEGFGAEILAQGTIWSDVVESGVTKFSSQIKPHHNVGGLPKKLNIRLFEPLRELFKDQVREVAEKLGLPIWVIKRKVFPGPGFAIRVQGEVTEEKIKLVKKATSIIEEVIFSSSIKDKIWMAFAIIIEVPSLGVKGDKRIENKYAVVVRIVESKNSLTAEFSRNAFPYLGEISRRLTNEVGVGRIVYDITDKPPSTIEWQ